MESHGVPPGEPTNEFPWFSEHHEPMGIVHENVVQRSDEGLLVLTDPDVMQLGIMLVRDVHDIRYKIL